MIRDYLWHNTRVAAVQYDGSNFDECRDFVGAAWLTRHRREEYRRPDGAISWQWILEFKHPLTTQAVYPGSWFTKVGGRHVQLAVGDDRFRSEYILT